MFDTQIRPVWDGYLTYLGSRQKIIQNFDGLGLPIAVLYFLALSPTSLKQYFADKKLNIRPQTSRLGLCKKTQRRISSLKGTVAPD
jgi:hypothetical protein